MTFFENLIPPPTSQSSILCCLHHRDGQGCSVVLYKNLNLNTISIRRNLHFSYWLRNLSFPRALACCLRLRACIRDVRCEAGHSIDRDTLAERSTAVAQGAIPKGRGFEPHRCHFCGMGCDHMYVHVHDALDYGLPISFNDIRSLPDTSRTNEIFL